MWYIVPLVLIVPIDLVDSVDLVDPIDLVDSVELVDPLDLIVLFVPEALIIECIINSVFFLNLFFVFRVFTGGVGGRGAPLVTFDLQRL